MTVEEGRSGLVLNTVLITIYNLTFFSAQTVPDDSARGWVNAAMKIVTVFDHMMLQRFFARRFIVQCLIMWHILTLPKNIYASTYKHE